MPVVPCLRPGALPCAVWARRSPSYPGKGDSSAVHGRVAIVYRSPSRPAISTTCRTNVTVSRSIPSENPPADFLRAVRGSGRLTARRRLFPRQPGVYLVRADDARSRPCPRPSLNTAASAPPCASVWSIRTDIRREFATTKVCYTGHTDDRLHTGMTSEGREARRRERVAGMPRPAPVAARSFSDLVSRWDFGGESRGIGRKGAGFLHLAIEIEGHLRRFEAPLPAGDRVPTPLNGRVRGRFRGPDQTRAPDR